MQTGTIDGLENPLPDAMAAKFYEVSKQVVLTGPHGGQHLLHARRAASGTGSRAEQKAAIEAAEDDGQEGQRRGRDRDREGRRTASSRARASGSTTPDVAAFRDQVQKTLPRVRSSPPTGPRACSSASTRRRPEAGAGPPACGGSTGAPDGVRRKDQRGTVRADARRLHHPDRHPLRPQRPGLLVARAVLGRLRLGRLLRRRPDPAAAPADHLRHRLRRRRARARGAGSPRRASLSWR